MKYCKNCGTLLEDTHEHCIRCGTDVTIAENVSMYPIEVMETIEEENQRKKASGKIVAMIIGLVVVLVALVIAFLALGSNMKRPAPAKETTETKDEVPAETEAAVAAEEESAEAEPAEEESAAVNSSNRAVKDDKGKYYDYVEEKDDAGNVLFTALLPEDLTERELFKDYEVYSDRYPISLNYTASTKENDVRFTYLSARKLWYKLGETGKGRSNESDITHYMTYFEYENPRSYLEPLL
ncbi:MAG: zinc ribbon domain-containing protein, partial [Lachnospiraceae bacterium]|nr:zinc ribbon domain-containing protein [Lachnospiraceae bacterium]